MKYNLVNIFHKLEELDRTSKTNEKLTLLKEYMKDECFRKVVLYALDPSKKFHIKKLPDKYENILNIGDAEKEIFKHLKHLSKSTGATNKDKQHLSNLAGGNAKIRYLVLCILTKDLKCGVSTALVNRVAPGFIPVLPYMRCSTSPAIGNITYPAIVQEKADAMFVNVIISENGQKIKLQTRAGSIIRQLKKLRRLIRRGISIEKAKRTRKGIKRTYIPIPDQCGRVYMGEIIVRKDGKLLDRKTSNGIINSCIQGTAKEKDIQDVVLRLWDCVPLKDWLIGICKRAYDHRWFLTFSFCDLRFRNNDTIEPIESKRVKSYEEAKDFYYEIRKRKGEGAILKNEKSFWKGDTDTPSRDQIKMKNESEAELIIIGTYKGEPDSKYKLCLGGLICESADGKIRVRVGGGFSDKQRGYHPIRNATGGVIGVDPVKAKKARKYWKKKKGSIVTVLFESIIDDKTNRKYKTLYLPRFDCERPDRTDADTLKMIKARIK